MINVELNITLQCTLKCWSCNRLCNVYPYTRKDQVSLQQIDDFIAQAKEQGGVKKVKVLGGEPLMHSQFSDVWLRLYAAYKQGIIQQLKLDSNHTITFPNDLPTEGVRFMGKGEEKKMHIPMIHPFDEGYKEAKAFPNCAMIKRCGQSLDNMGWLPCSAAIIIERLWRFGLYRPIMQKEPWGLDKLCPCCPWSMPQKWIQEHTYPLNNHPPEYDQPSKQYQERLNAVLLART